MTQSIKHRFVTFQLDAGRFDYNTARLNGMQECGNICSRIKNPTVAVIEEQVDVFEEDFSA